MVGRAANLFAPRFLEPAGRSNRFEGSEKKEKTK